MKKYSKWLLVAICTFFIAMAPSFAREFTLDELEDYLESENIKADSFYLIGEYAFTNYENKTTEYPGNIRMQDVMLAARSIKVNDVDGKVRKDAIFGEMTVNLFDRQYSIVGGKVTPTGIVYSKNLVGTTIPGETIEIKYIDYVFVPDASKATIAGDSSNKEISLSNNKLTGLIKKTNGEDGEGYYYTFEVSVDGIIPGTSTVNGNAIGQNPYKLTVKLDPNAENKIVSIVVDKDGADSLEYGPTTYEIDYSELVFEKESEVSIKLFDETDEDLANAAKNLKDNYNFDKNVGNLTLSDGKLTGFISPLEGIKGFTKDTGYYFAYAITLPEGKTIEDLKDVKLVVPADGGTKEVGVEAFDSDDTIVLIMQLDPDSATKEFEVIVDLDGDGEEYTPTTVKVNYEELIFSKKTTATVSSNLPAADVTELGNLFDFVANDANAKLEDGKLTGIISTGVATDSKFSTVVANQTGYYYAFNVEVDGANNNTTIEVNGKTTASYKGAESLTVLFALDPNATDKVITIKVDRDGEGSEYTTETYTIDYSELLFADKLFEEAEQNLIALEDGKSTLTLTAEGKDAADNVELVFASSYDSKTKVLMEEATGTFADETFKSYAYMQTKDDGIYAYKSDDNVNWIYTIYANSTEDSGTIPATLLGKPDSMKVTDVAADGTITLDVLLVKEGQDYDISSIIGAPSDPENTIITVEKDVHVIVKIKDELIIEMSADLLEALGDEAAADFTSIKFVVAVEKLTASITLPESTKNAQYVEPSEFEE